ncbi:LysR family transcriptional regulator [Motiliproteus sp. MSK22-1]|uniref:LysR family transcriptional regulator n=1 Tax=Motiliproteus sp. MSK22-1 TaxID=1897630 RepID=UPI000975E2C9|nr:LysR family transcriptional regulator [Motiliproteus sp. MSK22-1]OMH37551.1 LysR family transcriptional regulator [Motiliproteus sp. MSK22-1]
MSQWEGVIEFVAVAETESFTAAAKRLDTSVANISRQVSGLEQRLEAKLFYRTTRRVSVTETGQLFYQHCRPLLDGLEAAENAITQLQSKPRGKLRMTAPVSYGERYIVPLVNEFLQLHEELQAEIQLTNQPVGLVEQGFDLAIRLGRVEDSSLVAKRLADRTLYVCGSPDYLAAQGTPQGLGDLQQHSCLLGSLDYWRFEEQGMERNIRVKGRLSCNSGYALVDAALKGLGLIQIPDYHVRGYLESGQLVQVLEPYVQQTEAVWALYPQNRYLSPKVRGLIDYLSEHLRSTD